MAAKTRARSQDFSQRFWSMLSHACSELCVIILLYVAAAASYAATRLARICRLRAPCTLCSRLDHALHGRPWFSGDLVCAAHRLEISSLARCRSHSDLARSDDLCKRCLLAFAAGVSDEVNSRSGSRSRRLCSCCAEPFTKARDAQRLSETAIAVESPDTVLGSEEINRKSRVAAGDSNLAMPLPLPSKAAPDQFPADRPEEKTFVVGIEEVNESDGSPGTDEQSTKDNGASANAGAAKPVPSGSAAPTRIFVDRNSSIKNAFVGRVNLPSPRPSEIISARDNNSTTQQEVKAFLSQMSSARGLDSSWTEGAPSPGVNIQIDESNATGRKLERNYSVLEPSDGNMVDEAEGESSLENLKKHLDLNKKSMSVLYKELEEERSASAVAASQAMAMINRLHEEKAAMQMEALQYLRMMEEQADHDHEAIQNLHDLLTEREKELLDMDSELENCRRLLQVAPFNGKKFDATGATYGSNVAFDALNSSDFVGCTMSVLEDEKAYILESLSRLEEKLHVFTSRLASDDVKSSQDGLLGDNTRADDQHKENSVQQNDGNELVEENHKDECSCSPLDNGKLSDVTSFKDEISLLNTRLKALEADQKFLKQVLSSLKCSPDGLQCVQEITSHLLELRRVVTQ